MFLNLDHNEIVFSLCIFSKQKNTMDIRYRCLLGSETQQNHIFIVYKKKNKKKCLPCNIAVRKKKELESVWERESGNERRRKGKG